LHVHTYACTIPFRNLTDRCGVVVDRAFLFAFGFHWIHYKGCPSSVEEAPIITVAPHTSILDVFATGLYGMPTFVARDDVKDFHIFGRK
jgi:1-acyl-sn-glycerol-3-phosphate acyltransferase